MSSQAAQCKLNGPSFECTGLCKLLLLLVFPLDRLFIPAFLSLQQPIQPLKPWRLINTQPHLKLESAVGRVVRRARRGWGWYVCVVKVGVWGGGLTPASLLFHFLCHLENNTPIPVVLLHSIIVCAQSSLSTQIPAHCRPTAFRSLKICIWSKS